MVATGTCRAILQLPRFDIYHPPEKSAVKHASITAVSTGTEAVRSPARARSVNIPEMAAITKSTLLVIR